MGKLKTSITTILWGKIHSLDAFNKILVYIKEIGYDGVGLETRLLPQTLLKDPKKLNEIAKKVKIEIVGAYSRMEEADIEWAVKAGIPLFWVVVREKDCSKAIEVLKSFTQLASDSSITVALHNHLRTCFENESQIKYALQEINKLNLCFDTAHAKAAGIDIENFLRSYHSRIALIHFKDLRENLPKSKVSFRRDFVNIGEGIINFENIVNILKEINYSGHIMLEIEALNGKSPDELAKEGYMRLTRLLVNKYI